MYIFFSSLYLLLLHHFLYIDNVRTAVHIEIASPIYRSTEYIRGSSSHRYVSSGYQDAYCYPRTRYRKRDNCDTKLELDQLNSDFLLFVLFPFILLFSDTDILLRF